jgi:hypothetical protein
VLIGLGINIKIIPMIVLLYFGLKGQFRAVLYTLFFFVFTLIIPAVFVGFQYNSELLTEWKNVINPADERFVFENNNGCQSLNAVIPAYFFDFGSDKGYFLSDENKIPPPRLVWDVPYRLLRHILLISRLLVLLLFIGIVAPKSWLRGKTSEAHVRLLQALHVDLSTKDKPKFIASPYFFREVALLCLATLLIFPHQMKYSMLYFVPAGAYVMYFYFRWFENKNSEREKNTISGLTGNSMMPYLIGAISAFLLIALTLMGREIIGNQLIDLLDYYHFMGLSNIIFLGVLWYCHPAKIQEQASVNDTVPEPVSFNTA